MKILEMVMFSIQMPVLKAKNILNYNPIIPFYEGLKLTYNWNKKIIQ